MEQKKKNFEKDNFKKEIDQKEDISGFWKMNSKFQKELIKQLVIHLTNDFQIKDKKYRLKSGKRKIRRRF